MAGPTPERATQYLETPHGFVAYQVFGRGPLDLLVVPNWATNIDVMWQEPSLARYLNRLASFARVICLDHRGAGVSDPVEVASIASLDSWMDDLRSVLDAVDSERAAILGDAEGTPVAIVFTATYPQRVSALALVNGYARFRRADDYPIGMPDEAYERMLDSFNAVYGRDADMLTLTAPSAAADARFRSWLTWYQRLSMPLGQAIGMYRWVTNLDVRHVLPMIQVPTLVVGRSEARHHRAAFGRYMADQIPGGKYVELDGANTYPFHAGNVDDVLDTIEEFFTGQKTPSATDRMLSTVLFTDIVGSTDLAASAGDHTWVDVLESHDRLSAEHVERFRGEIVNHTGDGIVATFDGPTRAVTCALHLSQAVRNLGIEVRAGLHTGEIERRNGHVAGIAVHIASRVMGKAPDGGVAVSSTVRDLVTGSGFSFVDAGAHELKGVPGTWSIYEVGEG